MPLYVVNLEVTIHVSVEVEATDLYDARENWSKLGEYTLQEAKLAVSDEARCLDDYEFTVESVQNLSDYSDIEN